MLSQPHRQRGTTLVELVIGITIVALLVAIGAPSFKSWIQNAQIRTAADGVQNGLQLARAMAVQRNANINFQLVTTLDASCALAAAGPNWVVSQPVTMANAAGACDKPANDPPQGAAPSATDPYIIQKRPAAEGSANAVLAASQGGGAFNTPIIFNGLGRVTQGPGTDINIDITNPTGGACAASGGPMRCLRVTVSPNGQVRMCEPAVAFSATTPQGC